MNSSNNPFDFSKDEKIVRKYECTAIPKLFGNSVIGYLSITNKRLLYHSEGRSFLGKSTLISELPLEDVSGISTWISASFNWIAFVIFSILAYYGTLYARIFLPPFFTSWAVAIILMVPFAINWVFDHDIVSEQVKEQFLQNISPITNLSFLQSRDRSFYQRTFRFLFLIGMAVFAWNLVFTVFYSSFFFLPYILLLGAYFLIYRAIFGDLRSFGLRIGSRSAKDNGIVISGGTWFSLLAGNNVAAQTLNAGPARDAEQIIYELGALVTDIQQMGDLGVKKWTAS